MAAYKFVDKVNMQPPGVGVRNVHEHYEKVKQLGHGTYGEVYLAQDRGGAYAALKKIKLESSKEKRQGFPITAIREVRVLQSLKHPNIVNLREVCRSNVFEGNGYKGSIYLVFDYLEHDLAGLHDAIRKVNDNKRMPLAMAKMFMRQLMEGLAFCHSRNVLHRDLKASNLLISKEGELKLADFGLARGYVAHGERVPELTYRVITLWYRPPELLLGAHQYGAEVDVWSAGCIMWELLAGAPLFSGQKELSMLSQIASVLGPLEWQQQTDPHTHRVIIPAAKDTKLYSTLGKSAQEQARSTGSVGFAKHCDVNRIPPAARPLLESMLSLDPARRPTASDCLKSEFFHEGVMTTQEFGYQTHSLSGCHEFAVKSNKNKRPMPRGDSTPREERVVQREQR